MKRHSIGHGHAMGQNQPLFRALWPSPLPSTVQEHLFLSGHLTDRPISSTTISLPQCDESHKGLNMAPLARKGGKSRLSTSRAEREKRKSYQVRVTDLCGPLDCRLDPLAVRNPGQADQPSTQDQHPRCLSRAADRIPRLPTQVLLISLICPTHI